MKILPKRKILKRRGIIFFLARAISNWGYKRLTNVHVEFESDLAALKENGAVFLYTGLHRSLWETSGILSALHYNKLPIPVVGMGDNLVRGKLFVTLAKNTSVFLVKRGKTRKEIVESARELRNNMYSFMAYGRDVLLFPEGTRTGIPKTGKYGGFFPTSFDALLEFEKTRDFIDHTIKGIHIMDSYIIPFNCDYSVIREASELVGFDSEKPRTLRIWDSLKMLKHIKDVFITFGKPVKVSEYQDKSRKEIAVMIRKRCLDLVKILPVNVVGRALTELLDTGTGDIPSLYKTIGSVISRLDRHRDKFRGFENTDPEDLYRRVSETIPEFRKPGKEKLPIYKLYADYIGHFLN